MVDAGKRLAAEKVDVLICGGAPVALSKGPSGDAELGALLRRETNLPVVMANGAVVEALRLLGALSVLAVSPFIDARNQEIKNFLEASGFKVPATKGLGLIKNIDFASQSAEAAFSLGRTLARENPAADAIYIACPRWPSVDIITALKPIPAKAGRRRRGDGLGRGQSIDIKDCRPGYETVDGTLRQA
jgi:maleate isomerase